jgi:SWI/SNF-related matrix-associated actin-dependent regulator 1 of chromatin subfamily A
MRLLPHQEIGRDFLVSHPRALLADGMRVGKSVQSIAACDADPLTSSVCVITRATLRKQWRGQFAEYSGLRDAYDLHVFSYEDATKKCRAFIQSREWDLMVIDEGHFLKGRDSLRTQAVYGEKCHGDGLVGKARRIWVLTGTPSPNNASELWPMLRALFPETIARSDGAPMNFWQFTKRYCIVRTTPFGEKIEGNRNAEELKQRMAPIMLRRPSSIMGNVMLPPETMYLEQSAGELKRLEAELRKELGAAYGRDPETLDDKVKARIGRITGLAKVPALAERLKEEMEDDLDKVVVFGWHTDVLDALAEAMHPFEFVVSHGKVSTAKRDANVERFQKDPTCRGIAANILAEGAGRDYSAACELLFIERSWVPGDNDQAAARVTGFNQKRAVRTRDAVLPGSLDERLMEVNRRKSSDIAALFG